MTQSSSSVSAREAWDAAAAAVLRKSGRLSTDAPDSDAAGRLARHQPDGVDIPPLGTPSDVDALPTAAALTADPGEAPFLRGSRDVAGWDVRALISDSDPARAHRIALEELAGGVTSLWIDVRDGALAPGDLAAALDGVDLAAVPVMLSVPSHGDVYNVLAAGAALASVAGQARLHTSSSLGFDPIGDITRAALAAAVPAASTAPGTSAGGADTGLIAASAGAAITDVAARACDLGIGAIVVDGTALHDSGAGDTEEVGYTLAAGAAYLRILTGTGLDIDTACRLISFRYAVTDEQFTQIAKLRAARLAWARVCELSGAAPKARAQRQHAVTSAAMLTRYDPYVNMLRGTVATFAAAVGGADAITTLPFDGALTEPGGAAESAGFARRMARNVSALLTGESGLGQVADPAGGAGAVEMLTARLAQSAWNEFTSIESSGGIGASLAGGALATTVARARTDRDRRIASRRQPITGVSEFPNAAEQAANLPTRMTSPAARPVRRWAQPFEAMRDEPSASPVLLVRVGSQARASARMLFTENLLAAGGIRIEHAATDGESFGDGTADLTRAVAESGCAVVVVAGADADYAQSLTTVLRTVRDAGAASVFLAGRPAAPILAALPGGLLDGAVAVGDDMLEFLRSVRATLGVAS